MGKKASVFLLRKSSKKKFNFYEDYKLVGTTFNYTMYFKQIFFFHYWLKYTLQQLAIAPIDFFYIKRSNRLLVFVLVNKKYLLTFRELYDRSSNKNLNYSFLPYKQLMVLKWSRSKSQSFYNKKRNSISLGTKTKSFVTFLLKHCHFELLNFFFYLSFFYQLYWFFVACFLLFV